MASFPNKTITKVNNYNWNNLFSLVGKIPTIDASIVEKTLIDHSIKVKIYISIYEYINNLTLFICYKWIISINDIFNTNIYIDIGNLYKIKFSILKRGYKRYYQMEYTHVYF